MSKILINATQTEELRVAIVSEDKKLDDLDNEHISVRSKTANIYNGIVVRREQSLGAAFVNYGSERHGFLPIKEIDKAYFVQETKENYSKININDVIREGQKLLIQVDKDERGNKGAALTTFISLAGSYLVLMPNNPRAGGISRRIEGDEREDMRDVLSKLNIPEGMGVILRTAGVGKTIEELQWDLDSLVHCWNEILAASKDRPAPCLILRENDVITRSVRDNLRKDTTEIIVDTLDVYNRIKEYIQKVRSDFSDRVQLYEGKMPLFSYFKIEQQIEVAYQRVVNLRSGGSIVIDRTEALVSIDVNSAKATGGKDIEETAFNTNIEAAEEIARQLRIRDIGGLIVIDFIDMVSIQHQRDVTNKLREALKFDRARVRVGNITKFGLLEMSRQRLRPPLVEAVQIPCPRCDGQGVIRATTSLALSIVRLLEEEATIEKTAQIQVHVPVELATYLLNEKRIEIIEIEKRHDVRILIIPNQHLKTPKYKIRRFNKNEIPSGRNIESYKLIEVPKVEIPSFNETTPKFKKLEEPAVTQGVSQAPAPKPQKSNKIWKTLKDIFGNKETLKKEQKSGGVYTDNSSTSSSSSGYKYHNRYSPQQRRGRRGIRGGNGGTGRYYGKKDSGGNN